MSVIVNEVRRGTYLDSVALMRIASRIKAMPGVEEAGLMLATPANRAVLAEAGVLGTDGETAGPGDLVIALRAATREAATAALAAACEALAARARPDAEGTTRAWQPRTLRTAIGLMPDANLALVSVPGTFAAAEARKALDRGLHVMIFSDNVPLADEVALKQHGRALGRLVMGPDCGTSIIAGTPLGFANVVPRGPVGVIGASGTGIQEVTCLVARAGVGISHAIGTGGRDLKAEVGGITTLMALDALDRDGGTETIVIVSKPPSQAVAEAVLARVARSPKPVVICFLGAPPMSLPANAKQAATLDEAARLAIAPATAAAPPAATPGLPGGTRRPHKRIRGLYAGGTLAAEAQLVLLGLGLPVASNAAVPGARAARDARGAHLLLDLGDDDYTRGRPHPMLEPSVRDAPLAEALADPETGVVLLDLVIGYGAHADPAGALVRSLGARPTDGPVVIASVTGTDSDPQNAAVQAARLAAAGIVVAPSNAAAVRLAAAAVSP